MRLFLLTCFFGSLTSLVTMSLSAQSVVLYPENTNTIWYNLEEWIFSNANLSFRTYDFGSFDAYSPGHDFGINSDFNIVIDGLPYNSQWLNNGYVTLPNLSFSDIDSVIISFNEQENPIRPLPSYQISIFTTEKSSSISIERARLNQINDPGLFISTPLGTPNIEFINFPNNFNINLNKGGYRTTLAYTSELYSRTSHLVYNSSVNRNLFRRTAFEVQKSKFEAQRNQQQNILWSQSFTERDYIINLLAATYKSDQFYEWHALSGIEAPYSLEQYQISAGFKNTSGKGIYRSTNINFSSATSDTLDYVSPAVVALSELNISQTSVFKFPVKATPVSFTLRNHFYSVEDKLTTSSSDHHSYSLTVSGEFNNGLQITSSLGNDIQSIVLRKPIADKSAIQFSTANQNVGNNSYNYSYFNRRIGFSNLQNNSTHTVTNNSDFSEIYSQVKWIANLESSTHRFNGFAFFKHYWKLPNEFIQYTPDNNSLQLNTNLSYSDSHSEGLVGIHTYLTSSISKKLKLKTMLAGNLFLYGNDTFRNHHKSVPVVSFSESIQYAPDKNFAMELYYKYIPERTFYEYENLEQSNGHPPVNSRSISLLNFSSKMLFVNQMLELKFTLRNLLNSTEAYDTNGQYYNMSVYISGRLNLNFTKMFK